MIYTVKIIKTNKGGVVMYCKYDAVETSAAKKAAEAVVTAMQKAGLLKKDADYDLEPKYWPRGSNKDPVELDPATFLPYDSIEDEDDEEDEEDDDEEEEW